MSTSHMNADNPRGPKRHSPAIQQHNAGAPRKRRARYTWRACEVCRRRKGRCDGRKPCDFCQSRALDCRYSPEPEAANGSSTTDEAGLPTLQTNSFTAPQKGESIAHLVLALQGQLDTLVAHIEASNEAQSPPDLPIQPQIPRHSTDLNVSTSRLAPHDPVIPTGASATSGKNATRRFHGPTSPDYSLNAAEIKLRQAQLAPAGSNALQHESNPNLEDDQTDEDERTLIPEDDGLSMQSRLATTRLRQCLAQLSRLLTQNEILRLINVYQDVIGHLHPVVDIKRLIEQVQTYYIQPGTDRDTITAFNASGAHENTILILFLALAIALCAETVSQSNVGKTLYKSVQYLIKVKIASEVSSVDHVVVVLLASIHHCFKGELRLAWRTCGVAGRMAMELGLHRRDAHQHLLKNDIQRTEISALVWSIVILDRQWSAATGLPKHFQDSDFDGAVEPPNNAPYIKAMISYTFMSPKFEDPIYRVAAGGSYDQDDAFEVLNFQIDQWLKKALEGQNFFHPCPTDAIGVKPTADASKPPSATATLLYLRANAFRSIILRPFFLSNSYLTVSVKMIKPSLAIISDTISVLSRLNATTDIYKKQYAFFQHFLSSSCALLFLIIAYVRADQSRSLGIQSSDFPDDFSGTVKRELERAVALASAYSTVSQSSYRLSRRLRLLRDLLLKLDFLQPAKDPTGDGNTNVATSFAVQPRRLPHNLTDNSSWSSERIQNGRHSVALQENTSNGTGVFADSSDETHNLYEAIGEDTLGVGWWNDVEMLWPDWPNNEIAGLLAEDGISNVL